MEFAESSSTPQGVAKTDLELRGPCSPSDRQRILQTGDIWDFWKITLSPTWEGGGGELRQERTKWIQLQEGSPQCKRDGGVFWNTDRHHMALTATTVWGFGARTQSISCLWHLKTLPVKRKHQLNAGLKLSKGYCRQTVRSDPCLFLYSHFVPWLKAPTRTLYCRAETWVILLLSQPPHLQWVTKFWCSSQFPN